MGLAVVTVAAGGLPVVDVGTGKPGMPVTEATSGIAITKLTGKPGMPVTFVTATGGPAVTYPTWDPATVTAVTLSGGNLVATNTGTTSADQGVRVAAAAGKTSGKFYYEVTITTINSGGGIGFAICLATTSASYTNMSNSSSGGNTMFISSGNIWLNNTNSFFTLGARSAGNVIGIAVDLDNHNIWYRVAPGGNWNGNATYNPATNVGGVAILSSTMVPLCTFGNISGTSGNVLTANFGASAFTGAVPAGFTSGWPA